jgi:hypothetical protein
VARFGARYALRFRAPFLGHWVCTQGIDGEITHRDRWRHAFDFEVQDAKGSRFRGDGSRPQDYLCFRLPVLAAADGTVVKVVDEIEDNRVGEPNLKQNWGNLVLLYHAPGLYSMVCHLARGSVKVREGQFVRRGDALGACGSSGRSPIPHLHFQLQGSPTVGSPTLETELHDVVLETDDAPRLEPTLVVKEGQIVRNLEPSEDGLGLPPPDDAELAFEIRSDGTTRNETIVAEIDLLGARVLRSKELSARAYYADAGDLFRIYDTTGDRRSVVHLLQAALPTVPYELDDRLKWHDHLELRLLQPWLARMLGDFISPFVQSTSVHMDYGLRHEGKQVVIEGRSRRTRGGEPYVKTQATFEGGSLQSIDVWTPSKHTSAHRTAREEHHAAA